MTIERLDYSKPPEGETTYFDEDDDEYGASVECMWEQHKEVNDPPGIFVTPCGRVWQVHVDSCRAELNKCILECEEEDEARSAAWHWYDSRLELTRILDAFPWWLPKGTRDRWQWPAALHWTPQEFVEVSRRLMPSQSLPAVLQGKEAT